MNVDLVFNGALEIQVQLLAQAQASAAQLISMCLSP